MYLSLSVLPQEVRDAMGLGYLFCRAADTIADTRLVPSAQRRETLEAFRSAFESGAEVQATLADGYLEHQASSSERELLERLPDCIRLWRDFPQEERLLLREVVFGVVDGMRMDLNLFPGDTKEALTALGTAEDLKKYCGYIGGEPGRFWTDLCLLRLPELKSADADALRDWGYQLGCGLQITNILRDIPKDLHIGRCYLPATELKEAGLKASDLLNPGNLGKVRPVIKTWLHYGLENLDAGAHYVEAMPNMRLRAAVAWPLILSFRTLIGVQRSESLLDRGYPVKVSRRQVYQMLLGSPWTLSSKKRFRAKFERLKADLSSAITA
jgi:farnesyl-diphosphate farnesyltransferase